jgi:KaiC/GvpD/RAD55 family RecA-like ATPase
MWMDNVTEVKEVRRWLIVKKMRMTNHAKKAFKVDVQPGKGIVLSYPEEKGEGK